MTVVTAPGGGRSRRSRRRPVRVSGDERERAILAGAESLLETKPWHEISIDDLAKGAGISRSSFYFYFSSKEAVLLSLLDEVVATARRTRDDGLASLPVDPAKRWHEAIRAFFATWSAHRHVIAAANQARASSAEVSDLWGRTMQMVVDETVTAIELERRRGAAPPGVPARDLAICLNRMNEFVFLTSLQNIWPAVDEERVVDTLAAAWLGAIYGRVDLAV